VRQTRLPKLVKPKLIPYVYFVQAISGGPIKIGTTLDLEARLRELQCGNPEKLRYIGTVEGDLKTERALHKKLSAHRIRGEWFHPVAAVRDAMLAAGAQGRRDLVDNQPYTDQCPACTNCESRMAAIQKSGMCRACEEFAYLRDNGADPFASAA